MISLTESYETRFAVPVEVFVGRLTYDTSLWGEDLAPRTLGGLHPKKYLGRVVPHRDPRFEDSWIPLNEDIG